MSRAPRDPDAATTSFFRGAFEGWLDGRKPFEELTLCDEDGSVGIVLAGPALGFDEPYQEGTGPIAGESVPVSTAIVTVAEMGAAPRSEGRRTVKKLREQNAARPEETP